MAGGDDMVDTLSECGSAKWQASIGPTYHRSQKAEVSGFKSALSKKRCDAIIA